MAFIFQSTVYVSKYETYFFNTVSGYYNLYLETFFFHDLTSKTMKIPFFCDPNSPGHDMILSIL